MLYDIQGAAVITVSIITFDGRKAAEVQESVSGRGRLAVDTRAMAAGVYFYTVKTTYSNLEEKSKPKKIVISR
jgi:hypothetical protein